jgi:hypothetical protein
MMRATAAFCIALLACSCGGSLESRTQCYDISNVEAVDTAYRQLERPLENSSPTIGIPTKSAQELSVSKIQRMKSERGDGRSTITISFVKAGVAGELVAFVYEDCVVGWSPQFRKE